MDASALRDLIAAGEGLQVEFKRELDQSRPAKVCKEVAALASTEGGYLLIGVDDDGSIVGLDPTAVVTLRGQIENLISLNVSPTPVLDLTIVDLGSKIVLCLHVQRGAAPIYYADHRPYIRIGTSSRPAEPAEVIERILGGKIATKLDELQSGIDAIPRPAVSTAAAIYNQGELATLSYEQIRRRLVADFPTLSIARPEGT